MRNVLTGFAFNLFFRFITSSTIASTRSNTAEAVLSGIEQILDQYTNSAPPKRPPALVTALKAATERKYTTQMQFPSIYLHHQ